MDDRVIPVAHAHAAIADHPRGELALLERCGHHPHLRQGRAVAARISAFVAGTRPARYASAPLVGAAPASSDRASGRDLTWSAGATRAVTAPRVGVPVVSGAVG